MKPLSFIPIARAQVPLSAPPLAQHPEGSASGLLFSLLRSALPYAARSIIWNSSLILSLTYLKSCLFPVPLTLSDQTYLPRYQTRQVLNSGPQIATCFSFSTAGMPFSLSMLIHSLCTSSHTIHQKSTWFLLPLNSNSNIHSHVHHILMNYYV